MLIPTITPYSPQTETLEAFGLRILQFVIREECTATLTNEQLELADHFYPVIVAAKGLPQPVIERLAQVRRQILQTLRWRDVEKQAVLAQAAQATGTSLVPRTPPPPTQQPPAGTQATPAWQEEITTQLQQRQNKHAVDFQF